MTKRTTGVLTRRDPFFGAQPRDGGTAFRVWAPAARQVTLVIESGGRAGFHEMGRHPDGTFTAEIPGVGAGDLYRFSLDGGSLMPDPASRFQPHGVHGPSQVVDPAAYVWQDHHWPGADAERAVIYELHVGTFTPAGTFAGAAAMLPYLRDLGVTVVELMPVAEFAGDRNWGYDGVSLFAPSRAYGTPDDLRRFVDEAHRVGLAVMLDVVYNHLGPDGAYMGAFAPAFFTARHPSAWGDGVNLDGPGAATVRRFIIDNATHWLSEYHLDGLRLDATHALVDDSPTHVVPEIVSACRQAAARPVLIVAEDHRNDAAMLREREQGGWGLDGVWADDFHHLMRRLLTGDHEGYYEDFTASVADLATTLRQGWFFTGQHSRYLGHPRGTDPSGIPARKFVICLQNHDQIGNRAFGDRLNLAITPAAYRAASAVLLLAPQTPMLFMGQEWGACAPFRYFTDHATELGRMVVEGRRREFAKFSHFRDPAVREQIPSPQAAETFEASRLDWSEPDRDPHKGLLHLYRRLLELREIGLRIAPQAREAARVEAIGPDTLAIQYGDGTSRLLLVARLRGAGAVHVPGLPASARVVLTTEDAPFAPDGRVPEQEGARLTFGGPAAALLSFSR